MSRSVQRSPNADDCVQIYVADVPPSNPTPYAAKSNPKPGDVAKPQVQNYLKRSTNSSNLVQSHPTLSQHAKSGPTLANENLVPSNLPAPTQISQFGNFPKFNISKIEPPLPKISASNLTGDLKPNPGPITSTPKTVGKKVFIPLGRADLTKKSADKTPKIVGNFGSTSVTLKGTQRLDSPMRVGNLSPVVGKNGSSEILLTPIRDAAIDIAKTPASVRETKTGKTF